MLASVEITVDCLGRPAVCKISAVLRSGQHPLDDALYEPMSVAVRKLADAVNIDQEKMLEITHEDVIPAPPPRAEGA